MFTNRKRVYKILSECLTNRIKHCLQFLFKKDQTYCVPGMSIIDNLLVLQDLVDYSHLNKSNIGILSLDQEKAFDRVDHGYIFYVLNINMVLVFEMGREGITFLWGVL